LGLLVGIIEGGMKEGTYFPPGAFFPPDGGAAAIAQGEA